MELMHAAIAAGMKFDYYVIEENLGVADIEVISLALDNLKDDNYIDELLSIAVKRNLYDEVKLMIDKGARSHRDYII
jgi:hypothetical protein